jgi:hypothetical protein
VTLATRVLIRRPVAVDEVRVFCNSELLGAENPPTMSSGWFHQDNPGLRRISNRPGLGLAAILDVTYAPDGPMAAAYWADDEEPAEGYGADVGSVLVGFDTAYGFGRGELFGCSDLHAYFIARLAAQFGPVTWNNEYTGEWHRLEPGEQTPELLSFGVPEAGKRAAAWAHQGVAA